MQRHNNSFHCRYISFFAYRAFVVSRIVLNSYSIWDAPEGHPPEKGGDGISVTALVQQFTLFSYPCLLLRSQTQTAAAPQKENIRTLPRIMAISPLPVLGTLSLPELDFHWAT